MTDNNNQNTQQDSADTQKSKRNVFPRFSLKKTSEIAAAIWELGRGEPIRRLKIFDQIGKSPTSGPSRMLVTNSSFYGLTKGGYQAEYLEITEIGKNYVTGNATQRRTVGVQIVFQNEIFSSFINYWKDKEIPSDEVASDWLMRHHQLSLTDSQTCWDIFKINIHELGLTEKLSGKEILISKELALENLSKEITSDTEERGEQAANNETISSNIDEMGFEKTELSVPFSQVEDMSAVQIVNIDLQNGGRAKILVPSSSQLTLLDVKKLKTQIDILSNFIEESAESGEAYPSGEGK